MRFIAFACDYDETLARDGQVPRKAIAALERLSASGRKLLLVTGRELRDLAAVFAELRVFDAVVAENGAVLHRPPTGETKLLAEGAPAAFISALKAKAVVPLFSGQVIVATREPNQEIVLRTIRDLGLELQVIFNKGAVMVLPPGINKGSGLTHALRELGLSTHNCVAVGDAENDHAFLGIAGCAVAVANALPTLKQRADLVTSQEATDGVIELIEQLLGDDLRSVYGRLSRHHLLIGEDEHGLPVRLRSYDPLTLVARSPGGGESAVVSSMLDRLTEQGYQYCFIDPKGAYRDHLAAVSVGTRQRPPPRDEILQVLSNPDSSCRVNPVALEQGSRAAFFANLLRGLEELRGRTGRPAWILADESEGLIPADLPASIALPKKLHSTVLITGDPERMAKDVLASVDEVIAEAGASQALAHLAPAIGPGVPPGLNALGDGEVLLWRPAERALRVRLAASAVHRRPAAVPRAV